MGSITPDAQGPAVDDGAVNHNDGDRRKKWWKDGGTIVPIIISIAALVVSGLSYWDQHQASEASAISEQQSAARLITPYFTVDGSRLIVQNLTTTEVTNLYAVVYVSWQGDDVIWLASATVYFNLAALPPCSSATALLDSRAIRNDLKGTSYYEKNGSYTADPQRIVFEDSNQTYWEKSIDDDSLKKIRQNQAVIPDDAMIDDWEPITSNNCQ